MVDVPYTLSYSGCLPRRAPSLLKLSGNNNDIMSIQPMLWLKEFALLLESSIMIMRESCKNIIME